MVFAATHDEGKHTLQTKLEAVVLFFDSVQLKPFRSGKMFPHMMFIYKWDGWKMHGSFTLPGYKWDGWKMHGSFTLPGNPTLAHKNLQCATTIPIITSNKSF